MNLQIDIQENKPTKDTNGQLKDAWSGVTGLTGLWASMITTGGREFYAAQRLNAETTAVFKIRYITGITPLMRVKFGSRCFNIFNVNNVNEKSEYILLSCKEVV